MLDILILAAGLSDVRALEPKPADRADYHHDFTIEMVDAEIHNPWNGRPDPVRLRAYRGDGIAEGDLVAPTLRARPGQRIDVTVDNRLPPCGEGEACTNGTNIHTHGLWISPSGNADNVMLDIPPGEKFHWQFDIDPHHPAGTFWYHPHGHGNTLVQVGSGMAGALIIDGDRVPTPDEPGDLDILLRDDEAAFRERIFVFQQINYGCYDENGEMKFRPEEGRPAQNPHSCEKGDVGEVRSKYHDGMWFQTGRFTSVNGKVQPTLEAGKAGRFERWRMIHAGIRERVIVRLRKLADGAPDLGSVTGAAQADYAATYCTGEELPMWQVAIDGLARSEVRPADEAVLYGGTRTDFVTYFPEPGRYCVVHGIRQGPGTPPEDRPRVLAMLDMTPGQAGVADPEVLLVDTMAAAAARAMPDPAQADIREKVLGDLHDGMKLSAFVWHETIEREELTGLREATLNILDTGPYLHFQMNGREFDHDRIDYDLPLGGVEQWHVASLLGTHPLHIHVNPFQLLGVRDGVGRNVADPQNEAFDPDYAGLQGQWMDTILLKQGHQARFRTRYSKFTGNFVTHCHIMFHGDSGMMMHLRIYDPAEGEPTHAAISH